MWVFPGGAVDPADFELEIHGQDQIDIPGRTEKPINPFEDRAYYAAAIRECFEESGVLMTTSSALATRPTSNALVEARSALNAGSLPFNEILATWSMTPDATAMQLVARWVTPLGSPRRFDARFFITACPDSSQAAHDDQELVDSAWMTPQSVLDAFASGDMDLMTPTLRMLKNLSQHESSLMFFPISKHTEPLSGSESLTNQESYYCRVRQAMTTRWKTSRPAGCGCSLRPAALGEALRAKRSEQSSEQSAYNK